MMNKYYISKAVEQLHKMEADNDAPPDELAAWGATANKDQLALITKKGHIVGYGEMKTQKKLSQDIHERFVTWETYEEYELENNEWRLDDAITAISRQIGEPVAWVDAWAFTGKSNIRIPEG